jgi:hypothetical protein
VVPRHLDQSIGGTARESTSSFLAGGHDCRAIRAVDRRDRGRRILIQPDQQIVFLAKKFTGIDVDALEADKKIEALSNVSVLYLGSILSIAGTIVLSCAAFLVVTKHQESPARTTV